MKSSKSIRKTLNGDVYYRCNCCGVWKISREYRMDKYNKSRDGHTSRCKDCLRLSQSIAATGEFYCSSCGEFKKESDFPASHVVIILKGKCGYCKNCFKNFRNKQFINLTSEELLDKVMGIRYNNIKRSSPKRKLTCNITKDYLIKLWYKQKGMCALTGEKMDLNYITRRSTNRVSVDRIDSTKGYEIGNIQLVCHIANIIKLDFTTEEMLSWCQKIIKHHE